MAQLPSAQVPKVISLGVDCGTTSGSVAVFEGDPANPASPANPVDYLLEFGSGDCDDPSKTTTELDTSIVFSKNWKNEYDCEFGANSFWKPGSLIFRYWKMGAMGAQPYARYLAEACRALEKAAPELKPFTPAILFRRFFLHIKSTAQEHLNRKYGVSFDAIKCYLTYPISCSESLRILLLQEATAAGLNVMGAVSESMSIAHALNTKNLNLPPGARMVLDFGGATVDAAVVYKEGDGQLAQACPSDGFSKGGQLINYLVREWLKKERPNWHALCNDRIWTTGGLSSQVERCKRQFDGQSDQEISDTHGDVVNIPACVMEGFFRPLITGAVELAVKMCAAAKACGHPIVSVVTCGGVVRNQWFKEEVFKQLKAMTDIEAFESDKEPGLVARGALCHARNPLVENWIVPQAIGLGYDGYYGKNGESREGEQGEPWKGVGWIFPEGQDSDQLFRHIRFLKAIQPGSTDIGDHLIESGLYVAPADSQSFAKKHIRKNKLIEWDCDITWPATEKVFSQLAHLGTFAGTIPHKDIFPLGTETEEIVVEFHLTLEVDRMLLKGVFSVILPDGRKCPLQDVHYIPLPLRPWSEYENERLPLHSLEIRAATQDQQSLTSPATSIPSPSTSGRDVSKAFMPGQPASVTRHRPAPASNATSQPFSDLASHKRQDRPFDPSSFSRIRKPPAQNSYERFKENTQLLKKRQKLQHYLYPQQYFPRGKSSIIPSSC